MADAKYRFCLTDDEKRELNQMVSSGKRNARQVLDALILLNCDESEGKKQSDEIIGRMPLRGNTIQGVLLRLLHHSTHHRT